jgi:hypothetical protein
LVQRKRRRTLSAAIGLLTALATPIAAAGEAEAQRAYA